MIASVLALITLQVADDAGAPRRLSIITACADLDAADQANCLDMTLYSGSDGAGLSSRFRTNAVEWTVDEGVVSYTVEVEGRLNGGPVERFALSYSGYLDYACATDAAVALRAVTADNRPVIATDRGRFELSDPEIVFGFERAVLIDAQTGQIIRRVHGDDFWSSVLIYHGPNDVTVYRGRDNQCVTAPTEGQSIRSAEGRCAGFTGELAAALDVPARRGLGRASETDIAIARRVLGDDWHGKFEPTTVFRMQGHDVIVVEDRTVCT